MLNKKEKLIFYELVRNYIFEGKPQGSKLLAKKLTFKIPPSTLRFYFRKLFRRGLIIKIGKYGGRIPTDKGWKYYIFNYKNSPEIKIEENQSEKLIEKFIKLTNNICIYKEKNKFKFLGLNNIAKLIELETKETIEDILGLIETIDKIDDVPNRKLIIKLGSEIESSKSKNLFFAILKNHKKTICFLGPKRNYYHTLWSILNKLISLDERK